MSKFIPHQLSQGHLTSPLAPTEHQQSYQLQPEPDFSLREYWNIIRQHYLLILGIFIGAEVLAALILWLKTPLYTAVSTILIQPETPQVLASSWQERREGDITSFYRTQYDILRSRSLAASVILKLGLQNNPHFLASQENKSKELWAHPSVIVQAVSGLLGRLAGPLSGSVDDPRALDYKPLLGVSPGVISAYLGRLSIRPDFDTRLVNIAYTSSNPTLAARIANAQAQAFIEKTYELQNQNNEVARRYLEGELSKLEGHLEQSEQALNNYRRARGIVTFSQKDEDSSGAERMRALSAALIRAEERRIALQAEVKTINSNDLDALPEVVNSGLIQHLEQEVSTLEGKYASDSNQFTPDYPPVAQLNAQLKSVRSRLRDEIQHVADSIKQEYKAAEIRERELRAGVEAEKNRVMDLKNASLQDAVLVREVEANRALYKNVLERIKTLGVANRVQLTNVSVVDTAEIPTVASSPQKELCLVLSGFLALLGGVGLAFFMEWTDRGLKTASEVQNYLGLPHLATIVQFSEPDEPAIAYTAGPRMLASRINGVQPVNGSVTRGVVSPSDARSIAGEAYRAVRTGVLLSGSEECPKSILFTSATGGEGKSVTTMNTSIAFACLGERVLLIDADLRRPRCHQLLDQEEGPGLVEVLTGLSNLQQAVQSTPIEGLFVLRAGLIPPNPSELLASQEMLETLAISSREYDHVLIDSPPVLPVSDSVILSTLVDAVVLVAGRRTPKQAVRDACSRLVYSGARILGTVLNGVDLERERYYAPHMY